MEIFKFATFNEEIHYHSITDVDSNVDILLNS